jgi:CheY-like chemotaxis protein
MFTKILKMEKGNSSNQMSRKLNIFLAEDDQADCLLFKEALEELSVSADLTTFEDGEQLMEQLTKKPTQLPDVLFLDLNMPRKNGFVSLGEIKRNSELDTLPVIIFSTASEEKKINQVYRDAAHYYIRKPTEFSDLKKVIFEALTLIMQENNSLPGKEKFILTGDLNSTRSEKKSSGNIN